MSDGSKNFFNILQRHLSFSNQNVKDISIKVLQHNAFFAHPENVIVSMLGDEDVHVRRAAVQTMHSLRSQTGKETLLSAISPSIHRFCLPQLDLKAKTYHQLVKLDVAETSEPPLIRSLTNQQLDNIIDEPLQLDHPCHN